MAFNLKKLIPIYTKKEVLCPVWLKLAEFMIFEEKMVLWMFFNNIFTKAIGIPGEHYVHVLQKKCGLQKEVF